MSLELTSTFFLSTSSYSTLLAVPSGFERIDPKLQGKSLYHWQSPVGVVLHLIRWALSEFLRLFTFSILQLHTRVDNEFIKRDSNIRACDLSECLALDVPVLRLPLRLILTGSSDISCNDVGTSFTGPYRTQPLVASRWRRRSPELAPALLALEEPATRRLLSAPSLLAGSSKRGGRGVGKAVEMERGQLVPQYLCGRVRRAVTRHRSAADSRGLNEERLPPT
ncbi:hypothetical protein C8J57DRAFT_1491695 [Mycena rebaudengoi]|nr:hypothetical protein C8J57DRAFT_1491695 [Mycena rebaudengoi]